MDPSGRHRADCRTIGCWYRNFSVPAVYVTFSVETNPFKLGCCIGDECGVWPVSQPASCRAWHSHYCFVGQVPDQTRCSKLAGNRASKQASKQASSGDVEFDSSIIDWLAVSAALQRFTALVVKRTHASPRLAWFAQKPTEAKPGLERHKREQANERS